MMNNLDEQAKIINYKFNQCKQTLYIIYPDDKGIGVVR